MKINLGCGHDYKPGWLNVDIHAAASPDLVLDLEATPWPFASDSADHILLRYTLEHLGRTPEAFLAIVAELYRVAKPDGRIEIVAPYPTHSDALREPTHTRAITPELFERFDLVQAERDWAAESHHGALAQRLGVDFQTIGAEYFPDPKWAQRVAAGEIDHAGLEERARTSTNVIQWTRTVLRARKPFRPGRSFEDVGAFLLDRYGGLGDVLMTLGAAKALKAITGKPVFLKTAPAFAALAAACPHVDGVLTEADERAALEQRFADQGGVHYMYLDPYKFGLSHHHQIDAYLAAAGLTAEPALKQIELELPDAAAPDDILPPPPAGKARILLHAGIGDLNRTWPLERWLEVAERLRDQGHQVVAIGHSSQVHNRGVHDIALPGVLSTVDQLSLPATVALMRASDLLISTDSGPVQLAAATDIGVVVLYSVVKPQRRLPYRHGRLGWNCAAVVADQCPHAPCYQWVMDPEVLRTAHIPDRTRVLDHWCLHTEKLNHCMTDEITADAVFDAALALLAAPHPAP